MKRTILFGLSVLVVLLLVVSTSGADVVSYDETAVLELEPAPEAEGVYTEYDDDGQIAIVLTEENDNVAGDGVNNNAITDIGPVFTVQNVLEQQSTATVWIDHESDGVEFYVPGEGPIESEEEGVVMDPGDDATVSLLIDTTETDEIQLDSIDVMANLDPAVDPGTPTETGDCGDDTPTPTESGTPTETGDCGDDTPTEPGTPTPTETDGDSTPTPTDTDGGNGTPTPTESGTPTSTETDDGGIDLDIDPSRLRPPTPTDSPTGPSDGEGDETPTETATPTPTQTTTSTETPTPTDATEELGGIDGTVLGALIVLLLAIVVALFAARRLGYL